MIPSTAPNIVANFQDVTNANKALIDEEKKDLGQLRMLVEHYDATNKSIKQMEEILNEIEGAVVVTFFAPRGFGKSGVINRMVNNMIDDHEYPLPSKDLARVGVTKTVIDIMYGERYSLTKIMCTEEEYVMRCNATNSAVGSNYKELKEEDTILDEEPKKETLKTLGLRARAKIEEFEQNNSHPMLVKKLVLKLPSKFLRDFKVILRDVPGYDEDKYKHLVKESMVGTCMLACAAGNDRGLFGSGTFDKLYENGLCYSYDPSIFPSVALLVHQRDMTTKFYEDMLTNKQDAVVDKIDFGLQVSTIFDVDIGVTEYVFEQYGGADGKVDTSILQDLLKNLDLTDSQKQLFHKKNAMDMEEFNNFLIEAKEGKMRGDDFDRKVEFATSLFRSYGTMVIPPKSIDTFAFKESFKTLVGINRTKVIQSRIRDIRDLAIIILADLQSKHGKRHKYFPKFEKQITNMCKALATTISNSLSSARSYSNVPEHFHRDPKKLIETIVKHYRKSYLDCFDVLNTFKTIGSTYYQNKLKSKTSKKQWKILFPQLQQSIKAMLDSLKHSASQCVSQMRNGLEKKLGLMSKLDKDLVQRLKYLLEGGETKLCSGLACDVHDLICDCDNQVEKFVKSDCLTVLNSVALLKRQGSGIHLLFEKYQSKTALHERSQISFESPFLNPCRKTNTKSKKTNGSEVQLPKEESDNISQVKNHKYCTSNDSILTFDLPKLPLSNIVIVENLCHTMSVNEVILKKISKLQVQMSCSPEIHKETENFRSINSDFSKCTRVTPVFIIAKPNDNVVNILAREQQQLKERNVKRWFLIVTELCQVTKYKTALLKHAEGLNYTLIVLESEQILPYATLETCAFLVGQHLKFEVGTILPDDIGECYEYIPRSKLIVPHPEALIRHLIFAERVLYQEAFSFKDIEDRRVKLRAILNRPRLLQIIQTLHVIDNDFQRMFDLQVYYNNFTIATHPVFEETLKNPQHLLETLRETERIYGTTDCGTMLQEILKVFEQKRHVGAVSMCFQLKSYYGSNDLHSLAKPTHRTSNMKSAVNTYYFPSMKGIHSVSDDEFWPKLSEEERKSLIAKTANKDCDMATKKEALRKGLRFSDISLRSQMLMHGVGGFQVFCYGYTHNLAYSQLNYNQGLENVDSDEEDSVGEDMIDDQADVVTDCESSDEELFVLKRKERTEDPKDDVKKRKNN